MLELWPVILFGWPAILVALALSVMGVVRRRPKWFVVAAIVVVAENFCQVSALHPIAVVEVVTLGTAGGDPLLPFGFDTRVSASGS